MAVSRRAQANKLIDHYALQYKKKYGSPPKTLERHKIVWGFESMLEDFGVAESKRIVEFYFKCDIAFHPPKKLASDYVDIKEYKDEYEEDARRREELRKETWNRINKKD